MKKLTYAEFESKMYKFNKEHDITSKGYGNDVLKGVIVFTEDSFDKQYPLESRSYEVTNHNKAWIAGQCSNSIFGDALDGTDNGVRLDWYMSGKDGWKVDYCYIVEGE